MSNRPARWYGVQPYESATCLGHLLRPIFKNRSEFIRRFAFVGRGVAEGQRPQTTARAAAVAEEAW
jgi:hypothetical protein